MSRSRALFLGCFLILGTGWAQQAAKPNKPPAAQEPKEEDEELAVKKEYSFNPLQAQKELKIGEFYFKKGSYKAAANRFREATKWNPNYSEAWLRLGDSEDKLRDEKAARDAWQRYVALAPKDKRAGELRKKLESGK